MKIRGTTLTTPIARHAVADDTGVSKKPWSSKNTVDKLCPSFAESGSVVACEPIEGYPLTVTAEEGATAITRCGKNILNEDWKNWSNYVNKRFVLNLPKGRYTVSATKNTEYTYFYFDKSTDGGATWTTIERLVTNYGTTPATFDVTGADGEVWALWVSSKSYLSGVETAQIEAGSVATEFEPYRGETFAVGEPIPALSGVNTIYADVGDVTVSGKADPTVVIQKLTNAIIALGGNV